MPALANAFSIPFIVIRLGRGAAIPNGLQSEEGVQLTTEEGAPLQAES